VIPAFNARIGVVRLEIRMLLLVVNAVAERHTDKAATRRTKEEVVMVLD
jgi:hypothetical protein